MKIDLLASAAKLDAAEMVLLQEKYDAFLQEIKGEMDASAVSDGFKFPVQLQ